MSAGPRSRPGFHVVIPARYAASRLPGKPLTPIGDRPLIQHVWERAIASSATGVCVATDDPRIVEACQGFGADVLMTRADHQSGSDRVAEVVDARGWPDDGIVVNLQGDEPCMPPALIDQVAQDLAGQPSCGIATLAYPIATAQALFDPHLVKVVTDRDGFALYFSRAAIPWHRDLVPGRRDELPGGTRFLRHIGIYAYRIATLRRFVGWTPAPPERVESLEQLRALWHGERIHVGIAAEEPGPGVDTPADVAPVLARLGIDG